MKNSIQSGFRSTHYFAKCKFALVDKRRLLLAMLYFLHCKQHCIGVMPADRKILGTSKKSSSVPGTLWIKLWIINLNKLTLMGIGNRQTIFKSVTSRQCRTLCAICAGEH
jgi:hypothetical protein